MRITKKILDQRLKDFANITGYIVGYAKGNICLDKVPCQPLYRIIKITDRGEVDLFSSGECYTTSELNKCLAFAMRAIQLDRLDGEESSQYWASNKITVN